jgi:tetratricopeptide (TPR) repeat protein
MGKTQVAIEYAYRYARDYQAVFWLDAENDESLMTSIQQIADLLELPERLARERTQMVLAVQRWLAKNSGWLLIGDNLENGDLLQALLPPLHQGALLVTTRHPTCGPLAEPIELPPMSSEEGVTFLLRRTRRPAPAADQASSPEMTFTRSERSAAAEVVQLLEGLPLALDQAGAYIEETGCSIANYLQRCLHQRKHVFARRGTHGGAHAASVTTTLLLSLRQVERTHSAAGALLKTCAFLHPEAIPEEMFVVGAAHLGPVLGPVVADPYQFDLVLAALRSASLLTRHPQTQTFSFHRLVQAVLQDQMESAERAFWSQRVGRMLHAVFPEVELTTWSQCERLLPHVLACTTASADAGYSQEDIELCQKAGDYLFQRARYKQAEALFRRALDKQEPALGADHPQLATSLARLGTLFRHQGDYEQAEALFQHALSLGERVLGPHHLEVARLLTGLAALYADRGKSEQAELLYQRALQIWEPLEEAEPLEMARALNGLAVLRRNQWKYEPAERLYERALQLRERVLGSKHPEVAMTLSNLATVLQATQHYEQAEQLYQRALSIWEQTVGLTHPDVAYALNNLGEIYREQERYEHAQSFSLKALHLWKQVLGADHALVAYPLQNLAKMAQTQGNFARAEVLFRRALQIRERQLEPIHPTLMLTLNSLAALYLEQGKHDQAEPLSRRVEHLRAQHEATEHHDALTTLQAVAKLTQEQGKDV